MTLFKSGIRIVAGGTSHGKMSIVARHVSGFTSLALLYCPYRAELSLMPIKIPLEC